MSLDIRIYTQSIVGIDNEEQCIEWEGDFTVGVLRPKGVEIWFKHGVSVLFDGRKNKDEAPRTGQILTDTTKIDHQITRWCPESGQHPYMNKVMSLTFKSYQNMLDLLLNQVDWTESIILQSPEILAHTLEEAEVLVDGNDCVPEYSQDTVESIKRLATNIIFVVNDNTNVDLAFGFQQHNLAAIMHELQTIYNRYTNDIVNIEKQV